MGFNSTATTITLEAKLTPEGKSLLVSSGINLISKFTFGDSDANYKTSAALTVGEVPTMGGDKPIISGTTNGAPNNYVIDSYLFKDNTGNIFKEIEAGSNTVNTSFSNLGLTTVTGSSLSHDIVTRNASTESLTNLYFSFNLPILNSEKTRYSSTTIENGGFSDTSLSGFNTNKILVIGIDNSLYGESLDGKAVNASITTSAGTYNIYSTYQQTAIPTANQDANISETSADTNILGNDYSLLFSDEIKRPNGDITKSWATGFGLTKPFSVNNKEFYNLVSDTSNNVTADTSVGLVSLNKGFIVVTDPTIVDSYVSADASATTVIVDSVAFDVSQNITLIANRGEFGTTNNPTYAQGDTVRISEVGLYDANNTLIALAKPNGHIEKTLNGFFAMGIKINI